jgi:hypothetical protein
MHFTVSQEIQKLNKSAETISHIENGGRATPRHKIKQFFNKIKGARELTEQEMYATIKGKEKSLKAIDQL